jgi:hypothetical protein
MKRPENASDNTGEISVMRVLGAGRLQNDQQAAPLPVRTRKLGHGILECAKNIILREIEEPMKIHGTTDFSKGVGAYR